MPSPLIFFIFVIVIDLILKSFKDKKKIEEARQKRTEELQNRPNASQQTLSSQPKTNPSRDIMATLRDEIENERRKEIARRNASTAQVQNIKPKVEEKVIKLYGGKDHWDNKREVGNMVKKPTEVVTDIKTSEGNIKEDIIRGIIFSEILSEPKSIQNQKRSM